MKGIQALRERRDALAKELQDLVDDKKTPEWKPEHQEKYDKIMKDIGDIDAQIKRNTDALALIALGGENGTVSDAVRDQFTRTPGAHQGINQESRALRAYLTGGLSNLQPEDMQRMRGRQNGDISNAMSTTTGSEGGYTVATEYYRQLTQAMKAFGGIRAVATVFQTGTGATMNFPTTDATAEIGEIVGQNAPVSGGDTTFGNISMDTYKYSSKKIALPFELTQDSMFDMDAYIQALLVMRLGRITALHGTVGTGVNQPRGVVTGAAAGKVGTSATAVTYDDLVDLEHSVDPVYRNGPTVGWMMHDDSVRVARKIKDDQGRPIFVPGYEQGNPGGAPDRLLGRPLYISQEMPKMAANAKSVLFGDYKRYFIREVMDLTLFRMTDSAFTLNGQVGFVAFNRQGGNLIDAGGAVKYYQNAAA
jgi:HK97 family phage major capsid protein